MSAQQRNRAKVMSTASLCQPFAPNFDTDDHSRYSSRVRFARVAQWIERLPPEQEVAGSTPAAGITGIKGRLTAALSVSLEPNAASLPPRSKEVLHKDAG